MEYLIFEQDYLDIPLQDMPDTGDLIVCHDPQKRLSTSDETWAVVRVTGDTSPPDALGLFWEKDNAVFFAERLCEQWNKKPSLSETMKVVYEKRKEGLFPLTEQDRENHDRIKNGNLYSKEFKKIRNPEFHRLVFEFLNEVFNFQDEFNDFERFRRKVKRLIGDYKEIIIEEKKGVIKCEIEYLSWNFGKMDEYEFRKRFEKIKTVCANVFCKTNAQFEIINHYD